MKHFSATIPPREFNFVQGADREVKERFGYGKWSIPESAEDETPSDGAPTEGGQLGSLINTNEMGGTLSRG